MRLTSSALALLLLVHAASVYAQQTPSPASNAAAPMACVVQPTVSNVRTYFVRGSFTSSETAALWRTLETWTQSAGTTLTIRFSNAGETSGLIDCVGCLTLTRQEVYTNNRNHQASFNRLRTDPTGQLVSAWIGFNRDITDAEKLRRLLVKVLGAQQLPRNHTCQSSAVLNNVLVTVRNGAAEKQLVKHKNSAPMKT